jgi:hypothetical protein
MRSPDLRASALPEPIIPSASWPKHYKPYRLFNGCTAKITFDRPHLFETLRCCLIGEVDPCGLRSYEQIGLFRFSVSPLFSGLSLENQNWNWEDRKRHNTFSYLKTFLILKYNFKGLFCL